MPRNEVLLSARSAVTEIRNAYLRIKDELDAVHDADLLPINVDLPSVITATRGRLELILSLLDRVKIETPQIDPFCFIKLEDYVLTTAYAHGQYRATSTSSAGVRALLREAAAYRQTLLVDATALARRGQLAGAWIGQLSRVKGYKETAFDLLILYTQLRENWNEVEDKTALKLTELERAGAIADELMLAIGAQRNNSELMDRVILTRRRAFTLFARAYNQVRRAILFLRWNEGDGDAIAPSLYSGRRAPRARKERSLSEHSKTPTASRRTRGATSKSPRAATAQTTDTHAPSNGPAVAFSTTGGVPPVTRDSITIPSPLPDANPFGN